MHTFINVSNRLPITLGPALQKSSGGLVAALDALQNSVNMTWIGWPGDTPETTSPGELSARLQNEFGFLPVSISREEIAGYYHGFSNSSLWPLLHYLPTYMEYESRWWADYQAVNRRFAQAAALAAAPGQMVWVHDYQLMLVPLELRKLRPDLRIGFFLHTPFPSYELFRCHPRRRELLEGLLGADQIGFHTSGYLRHFQSTVLRILGIESDMSSLVHAGRRCALGVYPIGINAQRFKSELAGEAFRRRQEELRAIYRGKKLVLGVERLDYTKGLKRRLQAMDLFLANCPDKHNVNFILICIPSREEVPAYQSLRESIESQVGQINGRHATVGNTPVHFLHRPIEFTELCALYSISDVALVTPLRDGMNLVAKEFVACQTDDPGVLVLSEFAGAADELFTALTVNPYNVQDVADRLLEALEMDRPQRLNRMKRMRSRVLKYDARFWAERFLNDLQSRDPAEASPVKFASQFNEMTQRFASAARVALFLDYDGTLRELELDPEAAVPTGEILSLLARLAAQPRIDTFLISGRKPADLEAWLGAYPFTLIAEHGYTYRPAGQAVWHLLNEAADLSWKNRILAILQHYEDNTPGSWIEEKTASLVWHYRRADPQFGAMKAQQLVSELSEMSYNLPVTVRGGQKIVEVCSNHADKAGAVRKFLHAKAFDLVLCAGDDRTDETMFRIQDPGLVSIKVGPGATAARYRAASPRNFRLLLGRLIDALEKPNTPLPATDPQAEYLSAGP